MRPASLLKLLAVTMGTTGTVVSGLGINCRGSSDCQFFIFTRLLDMVNIIENNLSDDAWINNGQQIAVVNDGDIHFAAFLQNSGGAPGHSVKTLIRQLYDHGCQGCGSIPLFYPQDNNVGDGELTVNSVGYNCRGQDGGNGLCPGI